MLGHPVLAAKATFRDMLKDPVITMDEIVAKRIERKNCADAADPAADWNLVQSAAFCADWQALNPRKRRLLSLVLPHLPSAA
jgi:hypothetical protein